MEDFKTPFQNRSGSRIRKLRDEKAKGISAGSLRKLIIEGTVSELEIIIMELLYELEYLTGNLLLQCFTHGNIPPEYHWFTSSEGKNPYRKVLATMEHLGIIVIYCFCNEDDEQTGPRIYALSNGAREWMEKRSINHMSYFTLGVAPIDYIEQIVDEDFSLYEEILGKLARNQFHVKAILQSRLDFTAYTTRRFKFGYLEAAYYRTLSNWNLFLLPTRNLRNSIEHLTGALEEVVDMITAKSTSKTCVLIAAEHMEHIKFIRQNVCHNAKLKDLQMFFTTDSFTYHEASVFDHFIRYQGSDIENYETISLSLR